MDLESDVETRPEAESSILRSFPEPAVEKPDDSAFERVDVELKMEPLLSSFETGEFTDSRGAKYTFVVQQTTRVDPVHVGCFIKVLLSPRLDSLREDRLEVRFEARRAPGAEAIEAGPKFRAFAGGESNYGHCYALHTFGRAENRGNPYFFPVAEIGRFVVDGKMALSVSIRERRPSSDSIHYDSRAETGAIGLENQGATCYMNSLLQSLFHTGVVRRAVFEAAPSPALLRDNLVLGLQKVFADLQTAPKAVPTTVLTTAFGWSDEDAFEQQDVQELNRVLCDRLEDRLKGTPAQGLVWHLFGTKIKQYIRCINVDFVSERMEDMYDVQVSVEDCPGLIESLRRYTSPERLEGDNKYDAGKEHGKQDAEKGVVFSSLPPVLHVQLKRFAYNIMYDAMMKIQSRFEFPTLLDMGPFVDPSPPKGDVAGTTQKDAAPIESADLLRPDPALDVAPYKAAPPHMYMLHSVLVHAGGLQGGHYYTFVRPGANPRSKAWLRVDDEIVTPASESEAVEGTYGNGRMTGNAYMLAYVRVRDAPWVLQQVNAAHIPQSLMARFLAEEKYAAKVALAAAAARARRFVRIAPAEAAMLADPSSGLTEFASWNECPLLAVHTGVSLGALAVEAAVRFGIPIQALRFAQCERSPTTVTLQNRVVSGERLRPTKMLLGNTDARCADIVFGRKSSDETVTDELKATQWYRAAAMAFGDLAARKWVCTMSLPEQAVMGVTVGEITGSDVGSRKAFGGRRRAARTMADIYLFAWAGSEGKTEAAVQALVSANREKAAEMMETLNAHVAEVLSKAEAEEEGAEALADDGKPLVADVDGTAEASSRKRGRLVSEDTASIKRRRAARDVDEVGDAAAAKEEGGIDEETEEEEEEGNGGLVSADGSQGDALTKQEVGGGGGDGDGDDDDDDDDDEDDAYDDDDDDDDVASAPGQTDNAASEHAASDEAPHTEGDADRTGGEDDDDEEYDGRGRFVDESDESDDEITSAEEDDPASGAIAESLVLPSTGPSEPKAESRENGDGGAGVEAADDVETRMVRLVCSLSAARGEPVREDLQAKIRSVLRSMGGAKDAEDEEDEAAIARQAIQMFDHALTISPERKMIELDLSKAKTLPVESVMLSVRQLLPPSEAVGSVRAEHLHTMRERLQAYAVAPASRALVAAGSEAGRAGPGAALSIETVPKDVQCAGEPCSDEDDETATHEPAASSAGQAAGEADRSSGRSAHPLESVAETMARAPANAASALDGVRWVNRRLAFLGLVTCPSTWTVRESLEFAGLSAEALADPGPAGLKVSEIVLVDGCLSSRASLGRAAIASSTAGVLDCDTRQSVCDAGLGVGDCIVVEPRGWEADSDEEEDGQTSDPSREAGLAYLAKSEAEASTAVADALQSCARAGGVDLVDDWLIVAAPKLGGTLTSRLPDEEGVSLTAPPGTVALREPEQAVLHCPPQSELSKALVRSGHAAVTPVSKALFFSKTVSRVVRANSVADLLSALGDRVVFDVRPVVCPEAPGVVVDVPLNGSMLEIMEAVGLAVGARSAFCVSLLAPALGGRNAFFGTPSPSFDTGRSSPFFPALASTIVRRPLDAPGSVRILAQRLSVAQEETEIPILLYTLRGSLSHLAGREALVDAKGASSFPGAEQLPSIASCAGALQVRLRVDSGASWCRLLEQRWTAARGREDEAAKEASEKEGENGESTPKSASKDAEAERAQEPGKEEAPVCMAEVVDASRAERKSDTFRELLAMGQASPARIVARLAVDRTDHGAWLHAHEAGRLQQQFVRERDAALGTLVHVLLPKEGLQLKKPGVVRVELREVRRHLTLMLQEARLANAESLGRSLEAMFTRESVPFCSLHSVHQADRRAIVPLWLPNTDSLSLASLQVLLFEPMGASERQLLESAAPVAPAAPALSHEPAAAPDESAAKDGEAREVQAGDPPQAPSASPAQPPTTCQPAARALCLVRAQQRGRRWPEPYGPPLVVHVARGTRLSDLLRLVAERGAWRQREAAELVPAYAVKDGNGARVVPLDPRTGRDCVATARTVVAAAERPGGLGAGLDQASVESVAAALAKFEEGKTEDSQRALRAAVAAVPDALALALPECAGWLDDLCEAEQARRAAGSSADARASRVVTLLLMRPDEAARLRVRTHPGSQRRVTAGRARGGVSIR